MHPALNLDLIDASIQYISAKVGSNILRQSKTCVVSAKGDTGFANYCIRIEAPWAVEQSKRSVNNTSYCKRI